MTIKVSKVRGKRKNLPKRKPGSWGKGVGGADEASKKNLKIVKISNSDNVLPVCGSSNEYTQHCFFSQSSHESNQSQKSLFGCFTISAYRLSAGRPVSSPQTFFLPRYCVTLHCYLVPLCLASIRSQTKAFCVPGMTLFVEASLL